MTSTQEDFDTRQRTTTSVRGRDGDATAHPMLRRLLPVACLYVSYGTTLGLLGTGAPLALRAAGAPLAAIGLVQFIYLPIGLGFLWAPLLDRRRLPLLPHRTGWIVAAQVATAALMAVLSLEGIWSYAALGAFAVTVSIAAATMDLSLDALVVETVPAPARAAITTAKLVGSSLGTAAGIGLATMTTGSAALPHALLLAAAGSLVLGLPILGYPEPRRGLALAPKRGSTSALGDKRLLFGRSARLGGYFAVLLALGIAPGYFLIDLHLPLERVGVLTGPTGTTLGVVATLLSGALLARVPGRTAGLVVGWAGGVAVSTLLLCVAAVTHAGWLAAAATLGVMGCSGGLGVPVFATLYRWSEGGSAATSYAVLFGAAFLVSFPARVVTPKLAAALGWPLFFAVVLPLFLAAVGVLVAALARTPEAAA